MKYAPRCMRCATALEEKSTGLVAALRSKFRRSYYCQHCKAEVPKAGAIAMGEAYGIHLDHLIREVRDAARQLKRLELNDALRALDPRISREQIQPAHTKENLVRSVREAYRPILLDLAHGRQASLDVGLKRDETGRVIAGGVWGIGSAEGGERQYDLLFARVSAEQYIVYLPSVPTLWLHEAIRHKRGAGHEHHAAGVSPAALERY